MISVLCKSFIRDLYASSYVDVHPAARTVVLPPMGEEQRPSRRATFTALVLKVFQARRRALDLRKCESVFQEDLDALHVLNGRRCEHAVARSVALGSQQPDLFVVSQGAHTDP
jgi:hypothetical protein